MEQILVKKYNESFNKIQADTGILYELESYFTFKVPNAHFNPRYKMRQWDGNIKIFHFSKRLLYAGLNDKLEQFAKEREYEVVYLDKQNIDEEFSVEEALKFIKTLNLPFEPHQYQINAFVKTVRKRRILLKSPTASGKSLMLYLAVRYFGEKSLIVVPSVNLVKQMYQDFKEYGYDVETNCHKIFAEQDKDSDKLITFSTWQSIYELPEEWFQKFSFASVDECDLAKAKSLTEIMKKCSNSYVRLGTTATLDGIETNEMVLEGLFGPTYIPATTKELMDDKKLARLKAKLILLKHSELESKEFLEHLKELKKKKKLTGADVYSEEMKYLESNSKRNNFIVNLALSLHNNTLILFEHVERHGKLIYELLKAANSDKKIYFIHGGVDIEIREQIRIIAEKYNDVIIIASMGTFKRGVNIKNLHYGIFASPFKSGTTLRQSIGRGIRKLLDKTFVLFDIGDDLSVGNWKNITLNHFSERIKIYIEEEHEYKMYNVGLK